MTVRCSNLTAQPVDALDGFFAAGVAGLCAVRVGFTLASQCVPCHRRCPRRCSGGCARASLESTASTTRLGMAANRSRRMRFRRQRQSLRSCRSAPAASPASRPESRCRIPHCLRMRLRRPRRRWAATKSSVAASSSRPVNGPRDVVRTFIAMRSGVCGLWMEESGDPNRVRRVPRRRRNRRQLESTRSVWACRMSSTGRGRSFSLRLGRRRCGGWKRLCLRDRLDWPSPSSCGTVSSRLRHEPVPTCRKASQCGSEKTGDGRSRDGARPERSGEPGFHLGGVDLETLCDGLGHVPGGHLPWASVDRVATTMCSASISKCRRRPRAYRAAEPVRAQRDERRRSSADTYRARLHEVASTRSPAPTVPASAWVTNGERWARRGGGGSNAHWPGLSLRSCWYEVTPNVGGHLETAGEDFLRARTARIMTAAERLRDASPAAPRRGRDHPRTIPSSTPAGMAGIGSLVVQGDVVEDVFDVRVHALRLTDDTSTSYANPGS